MTPRGDGLCLAYESESNEEEEEEEKIELALYIYIVLFLPFFSFFLINKYINMLFLSWSYSKKKNKKERKFYLEH